MGRPPQDSAGALPYVGPMALPISITSAPSAEERSQTERCTGRLLGQLGPRGYVVLGDGVVVGPTGVVVVTILTCTERLRIHHGELWHGRFSRRQELARAGRKLLDVARLVARVDPEIPVRSMVCVVGVPVPDDPYCVLDIEFSDPAELAARIQEGPSVLSFDEVLHLAKDVDGGRRRHRTWRSPLSRLR